jgi:hypothetical protein
MLPKRYYTSLSHGHNGQQYAEIMGDVTVKDMVGDEADLVLFYYG